jgi:uncharacterized membrane protein
MINQPVFSSDSNLFQNRLQYLKLELKNRVYFNHAWNLFWSHSGLFIPFTILFVIIIGGLSFIPIAGQILVGVLYPLLSAGYFIVSLKIIRGEKAEMSDFFKGLSLWYPLSINGLIGGLLTLIGFIFILPGLYLYFAYLFSIQMVVDENLSAWESLEASRKIITKIFFSFMLFTLITYFVVIVGFIALGVGLLVTFPLYSIVHTVAYEDIKSQIKAQI